MAFGAKAFRSELADWHAGCWRRGAMCYFLLVGATREPSSSAWDKVEDRVDLPVDRRPPFASARAAFPADDAVWTVTHRGCSCDLLQPSQGGDASTVVFTAEARRAVAYLAQEAGSLRLYVRSKRPQTPRRPLRLAMTIRELLTEGTRIPTDCLIDLLEHVPSSHLS